MKGLTRRAFLVAGAAAAPATSGTAVQPNPAQPLEALYSALEGVMRLGRATPFPQRFDVLASVVDRAFDLNTILKVSVGLRWDGMDAQLQGKLQVTFRRFTIATYVANFDKYDGERFKILPGSRELGTDRIIATELVPVDGDHIRVDYVMRNAAGGWQAVDVLLDGSISRVAVQRSDFRKVLATGDAEALVASLRRKVSDLSDGTLDS